MKTPADCVGIYLCEEIMRNDNISNSEKILWSVIKSLYDPEKDGCETSNASLCEFMGITERPLQKMLKNLKKYGLLEMTLRRGKIRILKTSNIEEIHQDNCDVSKILENGKVYIPVHIMQNPYLPFEEKGVYAFILATLQNGNTSSINIQKVVEMFADPDTESIINALEKKGLIKIFEEEVRI